MLRGTSPPWPAADDTARNTELWEGGTYHGVLPLAWERLRASAPSACPPATFTALDTLVRTAVAVELARKAEFMRVSRALADNGVQPLVLKGTALAYTLYPAPFMRPRGDTDLLVAEHSRQVACETLAGIGYSGLNQVSGSLVSTQASFRRTDNGGTEHAFDVHWRSSNSPLLVPVLEYEAALGRAAPISELGGALGLHPVDALLFACTHRAGHAHSPYYVGDRAYSGGDRLIWLYDIHLLAQALSIADWQDVVSLAARHRVAALCCDGLLAAQAALVTPVPRGVLDELGSARKEPSSVLLHGSALAVMWQEFKVLPTWRRRLVLLRENLLPDPGYILQKYGRRSRAWLPWLYLRRAIGGVVKRLGRAAR